MVGIGTLCRSDALFIGGIQSAVADIVHDCAGKQVDILQNNAQRAPQVGLSNLVDVDAVIADLAVRQIIEPVNQVGDSSLSGAGRTDKRHLFAGLCVQAHVVQHDLIRHIAEVHVKEPDIALHPGIGDCAVSVGMFPRPHACAVVGLRENAVLLLGIDQRHIALVGLRLFVQQFEDTSCAGKRHNDCTRLLGNLADGHGKAAAQLQKGCNCTQR